MGRNPFVNTKINRPVAEIRKTTLYLRDVVECGDGEADGEHVPPPAHRLEGKDDGVHPLKVHADRHAHRAHPGKWISPFNPKSCLHFQIIKVREERSVNIVKQDPFRARQNS